MGPNPTTSCHLRDLLQVRAVVPETAHEFVGADPALVEETLDSVLVKEAVDQPAHSVVAMVVTTHVRRSVATAP